MTGPTAPAPGSGGPPGDAFFDRLRGLGLVRPRAGRQLGGVCAAVAHRLGMAERTVRIGVVVLSLLGGFGLLAYLVALALIPDEQGTILLESALHGDGNGIVLLVVIGVLVVGEISDRWWIWLGIPLAVITWWVVRSAAAGHTLPQMRAQLRDLGSSSGRPASPQAQSAPPAGSATAGSATPGSMPTGASAPPAPGPWAASPWPTGPSTAPQDYPAAVGYPRRASDQAPGPGPGGSPPTPAWGLGPGRTYAPGAAVIPPPGPRIPTRPKAGLSFFVTVVGIGAIVVGAVMSTPTLSGLTERPVAFALACAAGLAGLALLGAGARGLRAGGTATVATAALACATVLALAPSTLPLTDVMGARTWRPATGQADPAYRLGVGEGTLDLGALRSTGTTQQVSASIGLGELVIDVPDGLTVQIVASVGAGEVSVKPPGASPQSRSSGLGAGDGDVVVIGTAAVPDVVVHASVGLGEILVRTNAKVSVTGAGSAPAPPTSSTLTSSNTTPSAPGSA